VTAYIDSSVILRILHFQEGRLPQWDEISQPITSRLTEVECRRTLDVLRLERRLDDMSLARSRMRLDELLTQFQFVELSRSILSRAGEALPTRLRTLDAIHLATALRWRTTRKSAIVMATHDRRLAVAARASGLEAIGADI
jgi:predicted nucleic acid-binding protein